MRIRSLVIMLALCGAPAAHAVSIDQLHMVSEKGLSADELKTVNRDQDSLGLHHGDYPNSLHQADYPNSLHAADYPDSLHAGDCPDSYHAADYPNSRVPSDETGSGQVPQPTLDF